MLDNISVGNQIAHSRKKNGLTQEKLAEKLGISAQAISKWENGHSLPETAQLPMLAQLLDCSVDSLLMPSADRDTAFQNFVHSMCGKHGDLALALYQSIKDKFNLTISYNNEYHVFDEAFEGGSASFYASIREDFIIRIDVESKGNNDILVRIPLPNCSKYMNLIDGMPENIKACFRYNDCKSCSCHKCPYTMVYTFEGVDYRQCHFIGIRLDSAAALENILALLFAEHGNGK
jgi:transcriptional regulator with XRE-family HTH domain